MNYDIASPLESKGHSRSLMAEPMRQTWSFQNERNKYPEASPFTLV